MLNEFPVHPELKALENPHFPTKLQAVVWRNWGLVPIERLATVLQAEKEKIIEVAIQMGLAQDPYVNPLWLTRGYITIIRSNWHLLPYSQLLQLLDWTEEELAFTLKEDDFLWSKLGNHKPQTELIYYRPLTEAEWVRTEQLAAAVERYFPKPSFSGGILQ